MKGSIGKIIGGLKEAAGGVAEMSKNAYEKGSEQLKDKFGDKDIDIGAVVRLKSGGPNMLVTGFERKTDDTIGEVHVIYVDQGASVDMKTHGNSIEVILEASPHE